MTDKQTFWLVGRTFADNRPWEFQGLYTTEAAAVARCEGEDWFVAPVIADESAPIATTPWPGARRPAEEPRARAGQ